MSVMNKAGIANYSCGSFISIVEGLNVRNEDENEKCFFENRFFYVNNIAKMLHGLSNKVVVIERLVIRA